MPPKRHAREDTPSSRPSLPVVYLEGGRRSFKRSYEHHPSVANDPKAPGTLFLFRHGVKEYCNKKGYDAPLTPEQITLTSMTSPGYFPALVAASRPIRHVYVSPFCRTRETWEDHVKPHVRSRYKENVCIEISEYLGNQSKRSIPKDLLPLQEETDRLLMQCRYTLNIHETEDEFQERVEGFLRDVVIPKILHGESVVIVTHGLVVSTASKYLFHTFYPALKDIADRIHSPPMGVMTVFMSSFFAC